MSSFQIRPKVDETQEFIEIANDFSNPLDLVREAISNSFDANAHRIEILFSVLQEFGEKILQIKLKDDGEGMDREGLQSFFDLGNSLRRNNSEAIGEKGHGTKVYFNSSEIKVITTKNGITYTATMKEPFKKLFNREIPIVDVSESDTTDGSIGTEIIIKGYNNNRRNKFTHEILRDYILWFTKYGSSEQAFGINTHADTTVLLKGLNQDEAELLTFGHPFPEASNNISDLFDEHLIHAPDYYSKKVIRTGQLKNFPDISFEAIFSIEGNKVKYSYNPMIRRSGYQAPTGSYSVQERYGLWLCKDFIPIQRKNEWITYKGSEFTKFHAFFNCQDLWLTANRGSVENTPVEILEDIKLAAEDIYREIVEGDEWREISWLEEEAVAYRTVEKERKDFAWRIKKANKANVVEYKGQTLIEPNRESGVLALLLQLSILEPNLFPFYIVDYDTHSGIDVIAKGDNTTPIQYSKLYYVEFKHFLTGQQFNHSFDNLHSIVCWDTDVKHDDVIKDLSGEERKMQIVQSGTGSSYTKYLLDNLTKVHKIEVFVLKDYLKEKLGIEFRPRTASSAV